MTATQRCFNPSHSLHSCVNRSGIVAPGEYHNEPTQAGPAYTLAGRLNAANTGGHDVGPGEYDSGCGAMQSGPAYTMGAKRDSKKVGFAWWACAQRSTLADGCEFSRLETHPLACRFWFWGDAATALSALWCYCLQCRRELCSCRVMPHEAAAGTLLTGHRMPVCMHSCARLKGVSRWLQGKDATPPPGKHDGLFGKPSIPQESPLRVSKKAAATQRRSGALAKFVTKCLEQGNFGKEESSDMGLLPDGFGASPSGSLSCRCVHADVAAEPMA